MDTLFQEHQSNFELYKKKTHTSKIKSKVFDYY